MYGIKKENGIPKGFRTPVAGMKTRCPRPLDDGDASEKRNILYCVFGKSQTLIGKNIQKNTIFGNASLYFLTIATVFLISNVEGAIFKVVADLFMGEFAGLEPGSYIYSTSAPLPQSYSSIRFSLGPQASRLHQGTVSVPFLRYA